MFRWEGNEKELRKWKISANTRSIIFSFLLFVGHPPSGGKGLVKLLLSVRMSPGQ